MTYRDDEGNVQVDFVWGNMPLQPNDDRTDEYITLGNVQNVGWTQGYKYTSDTLRTSDYQVELNNLDYKVPADSHTIATTGYSNFPGYIENYAGDGDTGLERVVPKVRGLLRNVAQDKLVSAGLDYARTYVNYDLLTVESTGKVVTVTTDGNHELLINDVVSVNYNDGEGFSGTWSDVALTAKTADTFSFELSVAPSPALDFTSTGYVWTNNRFVVAQDSAPGSIVNDGFEVVIRVLNTD
jgi:hypothetical protein